MRRVLHPNRWFFWTIAVIIALSLGLLDFTFRASRDFDEQTAALVNSVSFPWKVYTTQSLRFSVRYPTDWQIDIDPGDASTVSLDNPRDFGESVTFTLSQPQLAPVIVKSLHPSSTQPLIIDGETGTLYIGGNPKDKFLSQSVLVIRGSRLYYIAGESRAFLRIIQSLRFLN